MKTISNLFLTLCFAGIGQSLFAQFTCTADFYHYDLGNGATAFVDTSVSTVPNAVFQSFWEFGNGLTSTELNPIHTYVVDSTYLVFHKITVIDSTTGSIGCVDSIVLPVTIIGAGANCVASFDAVDSLGQFVQFTNTSPSDSLLWISWDFGDGSNSNLENPLHTFATNGFYNVCMTVNYFDSLGFSCFESTCQLISITGAGSCQAAFTSTPDTAIGTGMVFDGSSSVGGTYLNYNWDFGDGNTAFGEFVQHTYAQTGMYYVCLTIDDSMGLCNNTFCDSVAVTGVSCNAGYGFQVQADGVTIDFFDQSQGNYQNHLWDFGDGTTSTDPSPTHTFPSVGFFSVCLTISDSAGNCNDQFCLDVQTFTASGTANFNGFVYPQDTAFSIDHGIAYLIQLDTGTNSLNLVDTAWVFNNTYNFAGVTPGEYLLKAALRPTSPFYTNYLPTYADSVLFWYESSLINITDSTFFVPDIFLIPGNNPGGPGFIGGLISQGANKQEGDPIEGVVALLFDMNDKPIAQTVTDADGLYEFSNLALGTYKLYLEIAGKLGDPVILTIDANNIIIDEIDFLVDEDSWAQATTSLDQTLLAQQFRFYPNPVQDNLVVEFELEQFASVNLRVYNLFGQEIMDQAYQLAGGTHQLDMSVSALTSGTYLLQIQAEAQLLSQKFVKR